jgi:hypothetical protein
MVCSIIDECRCYAYSDVSDPKKSQFCGVRRGPNVVPCPEEECCAGGCPGDFPKQPFRIIERPTIESNVFVGYNSRDYAFLILVTLTVLYLVIMT